MLRSLSAQHLNESKPFLDQILRFYGEKSNITVPDFENLVMLMSDSSAEELTVGNPLVNESVSISTCSFIESIGLFLYRFVFFFEFRLPDLHSRI